MLLTKRTHLALMIALPVVIGLTAPVGFTAGEDTSTGTATADLLPEEKQTTLGLYATSKEAYAMWKAAPDRVKVIDVRTPEEMLFVGHPTMAWKIPIAAQRYVWDAEFEEFPMEPLPDFVARVRTVAQPEETILVMCRSGSRSAMATDLLAKAGFRNVYNITDGMEGDKVENPVSVFIGQRRVNGWKNSGCPWTYELTPERMVLPTAQSQR